MVDLVEHKKIEISRTKPKTTAAGGLRIAYSGRSAPVAVRLEYAVDLCPARDTRWQRERIRRQRRLACQGNTIFAVPRRLLIAFNRRKSFRPMRLQGVSRYQPASGTRIHTRWLALCEMVTPIAQLCWVNCNLLMTSAYAMAGIAEDLQRGRKGVDFANWRENRTEYTKDALECLLALFSEFNMPVSCDKLRRLMDDFESNGAPSDYVRAGMLTTELTSLARTVGTELQQHKFLYVPTSKQAMLSIDPLPPLALSIAGHFDEAMADAIEACRCFGLGRNTASVFHCMRVLEVGLQAIAKMAGMSDPRPNWEPVIKRLDSLLKMDHQHLERNPNDRVPEIRGNRDFYAGCSAHFHAVKIAWRNRVMHIERSYGEQDAIEIMIATRGLMEHLAKRLPVS